VWCADVPTADESQGGDNHFEQYLDLERKKPENNIDNPSAKTGEY